MAKEISFSEFLKEGALKKEEPVKATTEEALPPIHIEPDAPAIEKELKAFWKQVRHFFRTGERPEGLNGNLVPALLAPYLKAGNYTNAYPIYISADGAVCKSMVDLIQDTFNACFEDGKAAIIRANLPRVLRDIKAAAREQEHYALFADAWKIAENHLREVDVHGAKKQAYLKDIDALKETLPKNGFVLRFGDEAPFHMLEFHIKQASAKREELLLKVKAQIASIEEYLKANSKRKEQKNVKREEKGLEFAEDLISFDKVNELMPVEGAKGFTKVQMDRATRILDILKNGLVKWRAFDAHAVITEALHERFTWNEIFTNARIEKAGVNEGYVKTEAAFDKHIAEYTEFIVAHRMAALNIKDEYKEEVHDDFFAHFSWHRLTTDELLSFPPVLFIGEASGFLKNNLANFSVLLSKNKPIRLVAIDQRLINAPDPNVNWEDASHGYRQELASMAIAHRSTQVFQCAINQPMACYEGTARGLTVDAPSFMQFLIPGTTEVHLAEVLKLSAAVEGRFFPTISYELSKGKKWGSRFDISANPSCNADWPKHHCTFVDIDGEEKTQKLAFTYADYKAITREKVEELMLIPESFKSEHLLSVEDYLATPDEELTGKVPYIWLVNETNCLKRAALPYMWVISSQERLDYWNYIQELGGINSYHVNKSLQEARAKWDEEKAAEIAALKKEHDAAINETRNKAGNEAMEKLANVLLGLDSSAISPVKKETPKPALENKAVPEKKAPVKKAPPKQVVEEDDDVEQYLESFKCTSCNDCINKYPHIFEYNEDKQAQFKAGHSGKFAEVVDAAENCPAKCIHPGKPKNMKELNIAELMKRAEKLN